MWCWSSLSFRVAGRVRSKSSDGDLVLDLGDKIFDLQAGASFGELSITGEEPRARLRTATIVCKERCMFATLSRVDYLRVTGGLEKSAMAVLQV